MGYRPDNPAGDALGEALPQCCQDWGRFGWTPGDWRARPHGWNVMTDIDLLPEVLCHHQLRKWLFRKICGPEWAPKEHVIPFSGPIRPFFGVRGPETK